MIPLFDREGDFLSDTFDNDIGDRRPGRWGAGYAKVLAVSLDGSRYQSHMIRLNRRWARRLADRLDGGGAVGHDQALFRAIHSTEGRLRSHSCRACLTPRGRLHHLRE